MQKPARMIGAVIKPLAKNPETLAGLILHPVIIAQFRHVLTDCEPPFRLDPFRPFGKANLMTHPPPQKNEGGLSGTSATLSIGCGGRNSLMGRAGGSPGSSAWLR